MTTTEIKLPRHLTNQVLHLAQISPDKEVCGLISAKHGHASRCFPIDNVDTHPNVRFHLDEHQQISAFKAMRENGEELFAIYHSHPSAPALPSELDMAQAAYPEAVYLIISLNTKGVLEMRGFKLADQQLKEIKLVLTE